MLDITFNETKPNLSAPQPTIKEASYIYEQEGGKSIADFSSQIPFYNWARQHVAFNNQAFLFDLATNVLPFGQDAKPLFLDIVSNAPDYSEQIAEDIWEQVARYRAEPTPYSGLEKYGYVQAPKGLYSPAEQVMALKTGYEMQLRGFNKDDKGRYQLNSNVFIKYALSRFHLVRDTSDTFYIYNHAGFWEEITEDQICRVLRDIMHEAQPNIWRKKYQTEYLDALKLEVSTIQELNPHLEYLNLQNGMINLDTFELFSHDPKFYSTIRIPISFNQHATCPNFQEFLNQVFQGDRERIANIQEAMGDGLDNRSKTQKAYFLYGVGSNGKSVLAEVFTHLYGKNNVSNTSLSNLGSRFGFQALPGKVANISAENEVETFDTQNFKLITGGDLVEAEQKYKTAFSFKPICTLFVLVNQLPVTKDMSYGYLRRVRAIPFDVTFKPKKEISPGEQDHIQPANRSLLNELVKEIEGILVFALEGLKRLKENDFELTSSEACDALLDRYSKEINPTIEFYEECVSFQPEKSTKKPDFHKAFIQWVGMKGYSDNARMSNQKFWRQFHKTLLSKGVHFQMKKIRGDEYIVGLDVVDSNFINDTESENLLHFNGGKAI